MTIPGKTSLRGRFGRPIASDSSALETGMESKGQEAIDAQSWFVFGWNGRDPRVRELAVSESMPVVLRNHQMKQEEMPQVPARLRVNHSADEGENRDGDHKSHREEIGDQHGEGERTENKKYPESVQTEDDAWCLAYLTTRGAGQVFPKVGVGSHMENSWPRIVAPKVTAPPTTSEASVSSSKPTIGTPIATQMV